MASQRCLLILTFGTFILVYVLICGHVSESSDSVLRINNTVPRLTESDLLYAKPITVDLQLLKREYYNKIEDLKRNNVLKRIAEMKPCPENPPLNLACIDTECNSSTLADSDVNFQYVFKPLTRVKDVTERLSEALGPYTNMTEVTFVTAASSNHYLESQALLKNLHENVFPYLSNFSFYYYDLGLEEEQRRQVIHKDRHENVFPYLSNFSFYYYDLGLEEEQRRQVMKYCRCEMRSFPFHLLPKRFGFLKGYTWKIILLQAILPNTEILIWSDASIRFGKGSLQSLLDEARLSGMLLSNYVFGMSEFTSKKMFDYFGDEACQYNVYKQFESGLVVLNNEPFVRNVFLKTVWACAIDPQCMCTDYDNREISCKTNVRKYTKCHRFDQAGITIILAKLFRDNIESFYLAKTYHRIEQGSTENYFAQLENRDTRFATPAIIVMIIFLVILFFINIRVKKLKHVIELTPTLY